MQQEHRQFLPNSGHYCALSLMFFTIQMASFWPTNWVSCTVGSAGSGCPQTPDQLYSFLWGQSLSRHHSSWSPEPETAGVRMLHFGRDSRGWSVSRLTKVGVPFIELVAQPLLGSMGPTFPALGGDPDHRWVHLLGRCSS